MPLLSEAAPPAHCTPSSPRVYSSLRTLRDSLAVLEQEFTQFREDTLANGSSHTLQANSEAAGLLTQHRGEMQELRAAMRHLEEDNQALRTELRRVREELAKTEQHSQSLHRDMEGLKHTLHHLQLPSTHTHAASPSTDTPTHTHAASPSTASPSTDTPTHTHAASPSTDTHTAPTTHTSTETNNTTSTDTPTTPPRANTNPTPPSTDTQSTPPHVNAHSSTPSPQTPRASRPTGEADFIILCDSNGKYLSEKRLFPGRNVTKIRCPTTRTALDLLSDQRLGSAKHILIHTGTNDLSTGRTDVAKALKQVAAKATQKYPAAKITVSTLLPRADVPQRVIHSINAEVSRSCALMPNVHLAHHRDIRHHHLYDQVHLNKEGVKMFAKVLKDTALGRTSTSNHRENSRIPGPRPRPPPPHGAPSPRPPMQRSPGSMTSLQQRPPAPPRPAPPLSYAAVTAGTHTAPVDLSQIRDMLTFICTRLIT